MLTTAQLDEKSKAELVELAREFEIEIATPAKVKKDEIVAQILAVQQARSGLEMASGILDVLRKATAFSAAAAT